MARRAAGHFRGEDPPVQELAGGVIQAVAVPHQGQGVLPGITPGQEEAEVRGGFREVGPGLQSYAAALFWVPKPEQGTGRRWSYENCWLARPPDVPE